MSIQTIGRYEIEDELGQGGMATVYLARDPYMNRQVAVKVLAFQLVNDSLFHEHFQREAELIASLEHASIVPVFDYGQYGSQPYIVMRYMAGGSLQSRIDKGGLKLHRLAQIIERVAAGLEAAHSQGIIHRDVKPCNILFDANEVAFLSDFGLARSFQVSTGMTGTIFAGTPEYMSPEQARNEKLDGRTDVYALGVVLYYALTGRLPYENSSPLAMVVSHVVDPIPDILAVRPDLSARWSKIIGRAMAKDRQDRYASAAELARDVREAASGGWSLRELMDSE